MYNIFLPTKSIILPRICCCCGGGNAHEKYIAVSNRIIAKEIDRHLWLFPICRRCRVWIKSEDTQALIAMICVIAVLGLSISGIYTLTQIGSPATIQTPLFWTALFLFNTVVAFFAGSKNKAHGEKLKPHSQCFSLPVRYLGWNGTVYHFQLSNEDFFRRLEVANGKEIVSY